MTFVSSSPTAPDFASLFISRIWITPSTFATTHPKTSLAVDRSTFHYLILCFLLARTTPTVLRNPRASRKHHQQWLITRIRLLPTTRRLSLCSTSEATAASLLTAWAIFCAPVARTRHWLRSGIWRRTLAVNVSRQPFSLHAAYLARDSPAARWFRQSHNDQDANHQPLAN